MNIFNRSKNSYNKIKSPKLPDLIIHIYYKYNNKVNKNLKLNITIITIK